MHHSDIPAQVKQWCNVDVLMSSFCIGGFLFFFLSLECTFCTLDPTFFFKSSLFWSLIDFIVKWKERSHAFKMANMVQLHVNQGHVPFFEDQWECYYGNCCRCDWRWDFYRAHVAVSDPLVPDGTPCECSWKRYKQGISQCSSGLKCGPQCLSQQLLILCLVYDFLLLIFGHGMVS